MRKFANFLIKLIDEVLKTIGEIYEQEY